MFFLFLPLINEKANEISNAKMTEFLDDNQLEQFRRKNMIWEVLEMVNKEENHLIQRSILAAVHNM